MSKKRTEEIIEIQPTNVGGLMAEPGEKISELIDPLAKMVDSYVDVVRSRETGAAKSRIFRIHFQWQRSRSDSRLVYGWLESEAFSIMFSTPADQTLEGIWNEAQSFMKDHKIPEISHFSVMRRPKD